MRDDEHKAWRLAAELKKQHVTPVCIGGSAGTSDEYDDEYDDADNDVHGDDGDGSDGEDLVDDYGTGYAFDDDSTTTTTHTAAHPPPTSTATTGSNRALLLPRSSFRLDATSTGEYDAGNSRDDTHSLSSSGGSREEYVPRKSVSGTYGRVLRVPTGSTGNGIATSDGTDSAALSVHACLAPGFT